MNRTELPRRSFLRGHFLSALQPEQVKTQGHQAIRPPWADLSVFAENCTACTACLSACEMQIIKSGADGLPEVDFTLGRRECSFCGNCATACEAGLFRPLTETAWTHKAAIQSGCLARLGVECRTCGDSCPTRAIRFQRKIGGSAQPIVDTAACNGCGACLGSCPTSAITLLREE